MSFPDPLFVGREEREGKWKGRKSRRKERRNRMRRREKD